MIVLRRVRPDSTLLFCFSFLLVQLLMKVGIFQFYPARYLIFGPTPGRAELCEQTSLPSHVHVDAVVAEDSIVKKKLGGGGIVISASLWYQKRPNFPIKPR